MTRHRSKTKWRGCSKRMWSHAAQTRQLKSNTWIYNDEITLGKRIQVKKQIHVVWCTESGRYPKNFWSDSDSEVWLLLLSAYEASCAAIHSFYWKLRNKIPNKQNLEHPRLFFCSTNLISKIFLFAFNFLSNPVLVIIYQD